ncbi:MAG: AMP-binding protein [Candidatus Rokubacteria bacterium]|nr:AMP-binding protein [Candidatus Rokubacteria bacterium]
MTGGLPGAGDWREATAGFSWDALWTLFDGDRERLNIAHECVDRHAGLGVALRLATADGRHEEHAFDDLAAWSSRFANFLEAEGVAPGDRVAIMLDPSLAFYGALFGALKRGAVAVPLFTLFGEDGLALRLDDCRPRLLLVERDAARWRARFPGVRVLAADAALERRLARERAAYAPCTAPGDLAVLQYTSGTTRLLPEAVRHTHRAAVTLMVAALYGLGLRPGDRYFCPSSPAWGHGLWHGTIAPLALGIAVGGFAGKFEPARLLAALEAFAVTNVAAAVTVYRMLRGSGLAERSAWRPQKMSYTGEAMDSATFAWIERVWGLRPCGIYGTTEVGVIVVNFPGFDGHEVRPDALGRPAPGWEIAVLDAAGRPLPPGEPGEIAVRRRAGWFRVKDRGWLDADGYLHHAGRSDDAIISAGFTFSPVEIEDTLLKHPRVREAAVVGVPDPTRGQVPKAFVVAEAPGAALAAELQAFVRERLARHEYPRRIEFVDELPKTPAGKVDRRVLRERGGPAG